jgi:hypothetical protein
MTTTVEKTIGVNHGNPSLQVMATGRTSNLGIHQDGSAKKVMKIINQIIKVEQNRPASDTSPFPLKALIIATLIQFQKVDHTFKILPHDKHSKAGVITTVQDIPTDSTQLEKYFTGFVTSLAKRPSGKQSISTCARQVP